MSKAIAQKVEANVEAPVVVAVQAAEPKRGLVKQVIQPTAEELTALAGMTSASSKIRFLAGRGYSTDANKYSGIANYLGLLTQHVRNVLTQPLKKAVSTAPTAPVEEPKAE